MKIKRRSSNHSFLLPYVKCFTSVHATEHHTVGQKGGSNAMSLQPLLNSPSDSPPSCLPESPPKSVSFSSVTYMYVFLTISADVCNYIPRNRATLLPAQLQHVPTYKLIGDSIDKNITGDLRSDHQTRSLHYFHSYTVRDHVDITGVSPDPTFQIQRKSSSNLFFGPKKCLEGKCTCCVHAHRTCTEID